MKHSDKKYLLSQFKIAVFTKNGAEFQSFFEGIMEKFNPDFQKVRPYGQKGDGGNDGWIKNTGTYYQVYAPMNPKVNESNAADKLQEDFNKLYESKWNEFSEIKEYFFVFNEKYGGIVEPLEEILNKIKITFPKIKFKLLLSVDLERIFLQLNESDLVELGFDIDQRNSLSFAHKYLELPDHELDVENSVSANRMLNHIEKIVNEINDENLTLEFDLLVAKCTQKLEHTDEAIRLYKSISKRFPNDTRSFLSMANIYLFQKDEENNILSLRKAIKIDPNFWMVYLGGLSRKLHEGEKIDLSELESFSIPNDKKIQSVFFRIYGQIYEQLGDEQNADTYLEKSIYLYPDKFITHSNKLMMHKYRLWKIQDLDQRQAYANVLLDECNDLETRFNLVKDGSPRQKALVNSSKFVAHLALENKTELLRIAEETYSLLMECNFDIQIEQIFIEVLSYTSLPKKELDHLLTYLRNSKMKLSKEFLKVLIIQFDNNNSLLLDGKQYFEETNNEIILDLLYNIENHNYEKVIAFIKQDMTYAVILTNTLKSYRDLRKLIITSLPDSKEFLKRKLSILLNYDKEDFDEAFQIIKMLDLTQLSYLECMPILDIIHYKEAWDFEIIVISKLLEKEKDEVIRLNLQIQLFNAFHNLGNYSDVITLGETILSANYFNDRLSSEYIDALITNTLLSCFERSKFDKKALEKANEILLKFPIKIITFEFKVGIEAEYYLRKGEPQMAFNSVIEGVKIKQILRPLDYAKLYFQLVVNIGNRINFDLESESEIVDERFVKLKNNDQWYYIGQGNELDAIGIREDNYKYPFLINKKIDEEIVFENEYSSEKVTKEIEYIFAIDKYIFWRTINSFHNSAREGVLDGVQGIEVPLENGTVNLEYLMKFLNNKQKNSQPLFELYCQGGVPLSFLAISEGGLVNAIGRIQQEKRGFINFSSGIPEEFENQKVVARIIVENNSQFYIDGTSALFLAQSGFLQKLQNYLPNMRVPQSVINFLANVAEKHRYSPSQSGFMSLGYGKEKPLIMPLEKEKEDLFLSNLINNIKVLEENSESIDNISLANKFDNLSERQIPAELCDASILAQKNNLPVLTEDYLYLKFNESETKKVSPKYCSSLALVRELYEKKIIKFSDYLDYFYYLTLYRFRFLTINKQDIENAVFGDGVIGVVNPEKIRQFNFQLTLSEEYGLLPLSDVRLIVLFFLKILKDDTITKEITERIFLEILEEYPSKVPRMEFGQVLLKICINEIQKNYSGLIHMPENKLLREKADKLSQALEIYKSERKIWKTV